MTAGHGLRRLSLNRRGAQAKQKNKAVLYVSMKNVFHIFRGIELSLAAHKQPPAGGVNISQSNLQYFICHLTTMQNAQGENQNLEAVLSIR